MSRGAEITVAGAGALGLTVALALADAGCRVTVCDPAAPAANASGVAAGMLAPVFEAALDVGAMAHLDLLLAARDLWPALAERAGLSLDRTGALAVGEAAWLERLAATLDGQGVRGTLLSGATARGLAPGLSPYFETALLTREDWRVDAGQALEGLRRAAVEAGVVFRSEAVRDLTGDFLVVATGAARDLIGLAPELAVLTPIKGHILRLAAPGLGGVVVRSAQGYAAPAGGGLVVGATMEVGVADPTVDPSQAESLRVLGERLFPVSRGAAQDLRAGVRAATPDGLPLVGASTRSGVLLATGARRNGWLLAPLAARTVVAQVTGSDPGAHAARLDPRRF